MFSFLLGKALPFALTLILGTAVAGLFNPRRAPAPSPSAWPEGVWSKRETPFGDWHGRACRARRYNLVAETKPLVILFKPDAVLPRDAARGAEGPGPARVLVTFGADGRVQAVEPLDEQSIAAWRDWPATGKAPAGGSAWSAVERAAWEIHFVPEMINGMPVSVTKEVEIRFAAE